MPASGLQGCMAQPIIDWEPIKAFMLDGGTFKAASEKFTVKEVTIRSRAVRKAWPLPRVVAQLAATIRAEPAKNRALATQAAETLADRAEKHREVMFDLTSREIAKIKKLPIRNYKDLDLADRACRRAAGLENESPVNISLIAMHEALNNHESDVIEAVLLPDNPAPMLPDTGQTENVSLG